MRRTLNAKPPTYEVAMICEVLVRILNLAWVGHFLRFFAPPCRSFGFAQLKISLKQLHRRKINAAGKQNFRPWPKCFTD